MTHALMLPKQLGVLLVRRTFALLRRIARNKPRQRGPTYIDMTALSPHLKRDIGLGYWHMQ